MRYSSMFVVAAHEVWQHISYSSILGIRYDSISFIAAYELWQHIRYICILFLAASDRNANDQTGTCSHAPCIIMGYVVMAL